jgi:hypothetical protein
MNKVFFCGFPNESVAFRMYLSAILFVSFSHECLVILQLLTIFSISFMFVAYLLHIADLIALMIASITKYGLVRK